MGVKELKNMDMAAIQKAAYEQTPQGKVMKEVIPTAPPAASRIPEFSVITCSINDERFASMSATYQIGLSGEDYEVIRISDAKSLAEGYLRGLSKARGRTIIFSHDDAAPIRPIGAKLRNHLRKVDVVAGAGGSSRRPGVVHRRTPHVFGQVLNKIPNQADLMLTVYGVPAALVEGIQAFDGFWFAANREVLREDVAWFDAETCNGFHMYDVDFSYRAYQRGLRVGVACDLSLCHASIGGYGDPKWKPQADRWMAKYGANLPSHKPRTFQFMAVSGADPNDMLAVMDSFVERTR
jgi:hypothetical protein